MVTFVSLTLLPCFDSPVAVLLRHSGSHLNSQYVGLWLKYFIFHFSSLVKKKKKNLSYGKV